MTRQRIAERITECLSFKPGLTAREIAIRLQIQKKEINSVLYSELKNKFHHDDDYCWWSNDGKIEINENEPAQVIVKLVI